MPGRPFVGLLWRVFVVGGIAGIDLGGAVSSQQRRKGRVDEGGVGDSCPHAACTAEKFDIHSRA